MTILIACHLFFLPIAACLTLLTLSVNRRSFGGGFYQLHLTSGFVLGVLGLVGSGQVLLKFAGLEGADDPLYKIGSYLPAATLVVLFVSVFLFSLNENAANATHIVAVIGGTAWLIFSSLLFARAAYWPTAYAGASGLFAARFFLGGAAAALAVLAMNVGHWYLIKPTLGIQHLNKICLLLWVALILRGIFLLPSIVMLIMAPSTSDLAIAWDGLGSAWVLMAARFGVGYLAPLVLGWMALQSSRIRSTQSATGILYALLVLLTIGEAAAAYLTALLRLPL